MAQLLLLTRRQQRREPSLPLVQRVSFLLFMGLDEAIDGQHLRSALNLLLNKFFSPSFLPLNARKSVYFLSFFLAVLLKNGQNAKKSMFDALGCQIFGGACPGSRKQKKGGFPLSMIFSQSSLPTSKLASVHKAGLPLLKTKRFSVERCKVYEVIR